MSLCATLVGVKAVINNFKGSPPKCRPQIWRNKLIFAAMSHIPFDVLSKLALGKLIVLSHVLSHCTGQDVFIHSDQEDKTCPSTLILASSQS